MGPSTDESRRMQALRELRTRNYGSLLIRTDFSNEPAWIDIRRRASAPVLIAGGDEFLADVHAIDDPQFEGLEAAELAAAGADWSLGHVAFLVDDTALIRPYPVVAVDLKTGHTLRVLVNSLWVIENNMSGGKPLSEYVEGAIDGVYFWLAGGISLAPDPSVPGQSIDGYRDPARFPAENPDRAREARHRHVAHLAAEVARRRRTPTSAERTGKPSPYGQVTGEPAARPNSFMQRRQDRQARLREGLGGDEELERIVEVAPEIAQLNELDPALIRAVVRMPRDEQQRIAQWLLHKALDRAGIADDPDVIDAITSPREEWYATHSTKELASKFVDHPTPNDPWDTSERIAGPYGPPRNAAMAAVLAIAAAAFPVPDISVVRTLHAACTTFGQQAPGLVRQLREHFDIGGAEDSE